MALITRVLGLGGPIVRDSFLNKEDGGAHLEVGLAAALEASQPGNELVVTCAGFTGLGDLRTHLAAASIESHYGLNPDVVVLDMTVEVEQLGNRSDDPHTAVDGLHDDLVAVFDAIKADCDAHVLVLGVSTFDPGDPVSNIHGLAVEPVMLRAHRVNLALFQTSHEVGLSVIDTDRLIAEAGGSDTVPAPLALAPSGLALVRDETIRIMADYGFFDGRTLVAQVGNRGVSK